MHVYIVGLIIRQIRMEEHDLKIIKNVAYAQNGYIKVMKEQKKNTKNTIIGLNCIREQINRIAKHIKI